MFFKRRAPSPLPQGCAQMFFRRRAPSFLDTGMSSDVFQVQGPLPLATGVCSIILQAQGPFPLASGVCSDVLQAQGPLPLATDILQAQDPFPLAAGMSLPTLAPSFDGTSLSHGGIINSRQEALPFVPRASHYRAPGSGCHPLQLFFKFFEHVAPSSPPLGCAQLSFRRRAPLLLRSGCAQLFFKRSAPSAPLQNELKYIKHRNASAASIISGTSQVAHATAFLVSSRSYTLPVPPQWRSWARKQKRGPPPPLGMHHHGPQACTCHYFAGARFHLLHARADAVRSSPPYWHFTQVALMCLPEAL